MLYGQQIIFYRTMCNWTSHAYRKIYQDIFIDGKSGCKSRFWVRWIKLSHTRTVGFLSVLWKNWASPLREWVGRLVWGLEMTDFNVFKTLCLAEKENIVMKHVGMQVIDHCRATCDWSNEQWRVRTFSSQGCTWKSLDIGQSSNKSCRLNIIYFRWSTNYDNT